MDSLCDVYNHTSHYRINYLPIYMQQNNTTNKNYLSISLIILFSITTIIFAFLFFTKSSEEKAVINDTNPNTTESTNTIVDTNESDRIAHRQDIEEELSAIEPSELSEEEANGLIYVREEEKLARDVYLTLYDVWGIRIFSNIARSEQSHTDSIAVLLERYEISDPVTDDTVGVFTNQELQDLYDMLIETGSESTVSALTVGATIEDLDIYDIQNEIAKTDNEDIISIYKNLINGSENHMRAFTNWLSREGASYEAQYISEEELLEILSTSNQRGGLGR
jgi:hypothetical protein